MEIVFNFERKIALRERKRLKQFITKLFNEEKIAAENLSYIFCSDDYLLEINRTFLKHDYYTDIITFDLSHSKDSPVIGEVYISVDTIKSNAKRFNTSTQHELHRVIFHGALHLCGYNDKTKKEQLLMTQMEEYCLAQYFK